MGNIKETNKQKPISENYIQINYFGRHIRIIATMERNAIVGKWPGDFFSFSSFNLVLYLELLIPVCNKTQCCCFIPHHVWVIMGENSCLSIADDANRMSENVKCLLQSDCLDLSAMHRLPGL